MVFTSIPAYLDPINWQQQQQQQQQLQQNHPIGSSGNTSSNPHHVPPQIPSRQPPPPPQLPTQPTHVVGSGTTTGSIRPGSMADRARMANIPMPEAALKCPRCDSANTKFCYFNNYSLSQPRHFCKTCRRYWTRGGALRNVPVGGGCRRNKRSKGSSSKSPATSSDRSATPSSSAASTSSMNSASVADMLGLTTQVPPLRLMPPLSSLTDYGGAGEIGLSYTGITPPVSDISFQLGSSFTLGGGGGSGGIMGGTSSFLSAPPLHFPLFAGLDATTSLYPFEGSVQEMSSFGSQLRPKLPDSGVASHQVAPVKMEENQELNLSRQFLGIQGSDQYWGGGSGGAGGSGSAWTDLSGLNSSSSTSNAL